MRREFVVTDGNGDVSFSAKTERAETFRTFKAARARAEELAASDPGEAIKIYELTAESVVPLKPVETSRRHSVEHYQD
jgi:hypothetical protein